MRDDGTETAGRHGCRNRRLAVPGAVPAGTARGALQVEVFRPGIVPQAFNHDFVFREKATAVSDFVGFLGNL
jgi:hypothetical protein